MKKFYVTNVDIASPKSMWQFLKDHFTYSTMNSWNGMKSIAHNVKLYNLGLEGDWGIVARYLADESDAGCLQMFISDEIQEFERENPCYRVGFNGRSGGYLVLYNKDNYRSVLPDCVDDYDSYEEFKEGVRCYGYKVSDFEYELRQSVAIVREFDKLCDRLCCLVNGYSTRSFELDLMETALNYFTDLYQEDLDEFEVVGPNINIIGPVIELNDVGKYNTFLHCLLDCFGSFRNRIVVKENRLWLKED